MTPRDCFASACPAPCAVDTGNRRPDPSGELAEYFCAGCGCYWYAEPGLEARCCEYFLDLAGEACGQCATGKTGGGAAAEVYYCDAHAPCSCGDYLVCAGETIEVYDAMPGEVNRHRRPMPCEIEPEEEPQREEAP